MQYSEQASNIGLEIKNYYMYLVSSQTFNLHFAYNLTS